MAQSRDSSSKDRVSIVSGLTVAVVGATGAVGREMIQVLQDRQFPIKNLVALASEKSAGEEIEFGDDSVTVQRLSAESFSGVDIALFSAGGSVSAEYGKIAAEAGTIVVDNSSYFRMNPEVPLIVPEVNSAELKIFLEQLEQGKGAIIANPNCSTIQLVVALKPIHDAVGVKRVVVSTYQSVSGAGKTGMDELWNQTLAICNQGELVVNKFPHQIAFNVLPHIDSFLENGYTKEEMKVVNESKKILGMPGLRLTCTAVRVPVFSCHSESVNVETERKLTAEECRKLLKQSPGIILADDVTENEYPLAINLAGTDATYVGRVREDESLENGLNFWIVADNLRKGAALNAVQIAELVYAQRFSC